MGTYISPCILMAKCVNSKLSQGREYVDSEFTTLNVNRRRLNASRIFEAVMNKSNAIMITLESISLIEKSRSRLSQNGVLTYMAEVNGNGAIQPSLKNCMRELATRLLTKGLKVIYIVDYTRQLNKNDLQRLANGLGITYIDLTKVTSDKAEELLNRIFDQSPIKIYPSMSNLMRNANLISTGGDFGMSSFSILRQYAAFERHLTIAFAAVVRKHYYINVPDDSDIIYVVGYNPLYIEAAVMNGIRVRYYDVDDKYVKMKKSIFPDLLSYGAQVSAIKPTDFDMPDAQRKLDQIDSSMMQYARTIIYIGSYPGDHMARYYLGTRKIILIDPKINLQNISELKNISSNSIMVSENFEFTADYMQRLLNHYEVDGDYAIIDDSYDTSVGYDSFQDMKISFFESVFANNECIRPGASLVAASVKMNYNLDRKIRYAKSILFQPLSGDLSEIRFIMHRSGREFLYNAKVMRDDYLKRFHLMAQDKKDRMIAEYHKDFIITEDVVKEIIIPNRIILALYSITNVRNNRMAVKKWLKDCQLARCTVIFNAPNKGRVQYMISNKFKPGVNIKLDGSTIVFNSPTGKVWKDHTFTPGEMLEIGYIRVTPEMIAGLLGSQYRGPGYYTTSHYSNLFDLYIPEYLMDPFFKFQHAGIGPMSVVKCYTTMLRDELEIPRKDYYDLRAALVERLLIFYGTPRKAFSVIGSERCAILVTESFSVVTKYGTLTFILDNGNPISVNISGHLLSLTIASHFQPVAIDAWILQLYVMANDRLTVDVQTGCAGCSPIMFFDNSITDDGTYFKSWHSKQELLLTVCILEEYVYTIMKGNYSPDIVQSVIHSFVKVSRSLFLEDRERLC